MRFFSALCLILICVFCSAQSRIEFSRLGVNEGLSQNSVYAIHQDLQGFLWIGTGDGLNRYDGKGFKIYREKYGDTSGKALPGRIVTSTIIEDKQQQLWFNTNNGLVVFNKKEERFLQPYLKNSKIKNWQQDATPLGADAKNNIWLATKTQLLVLDQQTWRFNYITTAPELKEAVFIDNIIYFITSNGLFSFSTATQGSKQLAEINNAQQLQLIYKNRIAVSNQNGRAWIFNIETAEKKEIFLNDKFGKPSASADILYEYPHNCFYIRIPGEGLQRKKIETGETIFLKHEEGNSSSLSNNYITTSFVDRSNNLWIGTEGGGLSRMDLKPQKFKSFPAYNVNVKQAANLMVKSIFTINNKTLVGTFSQGLYVLDSSGLNFRKLSLNNPGNATEPAINFIQQDKDGRTWINSGNTIGYIDTTTFKLKERASVNSYNKDQQLPKPWLYSLVEYKKNNFLVGSFDGLHRMQLVNGKIITSNISSDSIMNGYIQTLQMAPDGTIYVGKIRNGFWRIRVTNDVIKVIDNGLLTTGIRHFYFDEKKPLVWMASESGLIAYNSKNNNYKIYDENTGLSNSYIYGILAENDSTLWLSTNKGINRAVISYNSNNTLSIKFNHFTQIDGLQSNEFNTGAFHESKDGTLYFGGVNGINWFKPLQVISNHYEPSLALTHFAINEKEYSSATAVNYLSGVELSYDQNTLYLRFASLEFTNSGANQYAYKLEGFDKDWIYSQTINEARYANLPPGNYLFKVKASNSDGVWVDKPLTMSIIIKPPFWATTWFRILAVVAILLLVAYSIRFYISLQIKNKLKEMEKQKAVNEERLRISKDMHDELGTGLTKIALLSEVTRKGLSQTKKESSLAEISNTSRQLTQKMGEIIWTLNPINDSVDNLVSYIKEQLYELSETASLEIKFDIPAHIPAIKISNLQRQQILLVTKEGFNNILKYAEATLVEFTMKLAKDHIVFLLEDNGIGFNKDKVKAATNGRRNGLSNMEWRMLQAGGSFSIDSEPGKGTTLYYMVPLTK